MYSDPGAFTKFWWKGVDIAANAFSGAVVALCALGVWRFQQSWQRRLHLKHEKEDAIRKRRERLAVLKKTQSVFWEEAATLTKDLEDVARFRIPVAALFQKYLLWLEENSIARHSDNWKRYNAMKTALASPLTDGELMRLPDNIIGIKLPDPEKDLSFPW